MANLYFPFSSFMFLLPYLLFYIALSKTNFTTDESTLLTFKSSISDPHNVLANWSISSSHCNWVGVTCDAHYQRVKILNLGEKGLKGTLPPELGNLSFLVKLDLHSNNFYDQLPKELAQLRRLKLLNLSYNEFSGEIPTWIGSLYTLQHFILCNNNFRGVIPPSISNLSKLETLDWHSNHINGSLPLDIGRLQHLRILRIAINSLSGSIPPTIFNLPSLERLSLSYNSLTGDILEKTGNLQNLKVIYLSINNPFGHISRGDIPTEIGNLQNLKIIYLGTNNLSGHISRGIGNLTMLQALDLSNNDLEGEIPYSLFNIPSLKEVSLFNNKFGGTLPQEMCHHLPQLEVFSLTANLFKGGIPRSIGNCTMLRELYLNANFFTGKIPRPIGNCTMLRTLRLDDNLFTGSIPMQIGNLPKLEDLVLSHNKLSGFIPSKIFNISTLEHLYLQNNSLSSSLPSNFGCGLPNLEKLLLWGNKLFGRIPSTISNASKLIGIGLSENKFTGIIPSTLGDLRYLEILEIHNNNLTTTDASTFETSFFSSLTKCRYLTSLVCSVNPLYIKLPKSIGNFSDSLQHLWLDSCHINGNIPSEIGNLSNLIRLHLNENELNGPIPVTIGNLHGLQQLDLQDNELNGPLIDKLCEIRELGSLYLSRNKFFGAMPPCLGNLTSLRKLDLSYNKLISDIPFTFWDLKDILIVNLSSNMLAGKLDSGIENLKVLILLDLSRNKISGNIPKTIGGLQSLQILSLALNQLEGPIPESLGNMVSLEFLDLSENNLLGEIPKSLESLASLRYVNLSCNKLQGEIPTGGIFRNLTAKSFMMNEALCGKLQLQVPPCKKGIRQWSMAKLLLLKYILPTVVSMILVVSCFIYLQPKRPNSSDPVERDMVTLRVPARISYFEILQATNGFDESNFLGRGSYGSVFKGKLLSGMMVAVKIFNLDSEVMSKSFEVECNAMRNLSHRNLVKIITSCSNIDFKSLVMEFIPNGSLEKRLYSHNYCLDFLQRLNIMIDVASALEYLHHDLSTPVVHCDLKPTNILLDDDMIAHVSDFGICKLLKEGLSKTHTQTMSTIGYIAPEYGSAGVVSTKADVYSYGIILMEVFTRKRPTEDMFASRLSLKSWVSESMPHAIDQVMDSNLLQGDEPHIRNIMTSTSSVFELALTCCTNFRETRNNMRDVAVSLNKIKVLFLQRHQRHI